MATWQRIAGFPKKNETVSGKTIEDRYYSVSSDESELPDMLDPYEVDSVLLLRQKNVYPDESMMFYYCDMIYSQDAGGSYESTSDGDPIYTLSAGAIERAIEKHPNYRTKWNYFLGQVSGASSLSGYDDATTLEDLVSGDYRWFKTLADIEASDTYTYKYEPTKKGVEAYIVPAPIVEEKRWYKDRYSAQAQAKYIAEIKNPIVKFGFNTYEFLVVSASVQPDGKRWLLQISYQAAPDWDDELYPS